MARSAAEQEFLDSVADEIGVMATWVSGRHRQKALALEKRVRDYDGTAASAKDLTPAPPEEKVSTTTSTGSTPS